MSDAKFREGQGLYQQRRMADAERAFAEVVREQPSQFRAWHLLGAIALQTNRPELSIKFCDTTIAVKPDFAPAYVTRGTALRGLGHLEEAVSSYDKAITIEPNAALAFSNRGIVLAALGRLEDALSSCDRALAIRPDLVETHNQRGNILRAMQRPAEAVKSYDNAIALQPSHAAAHNNRGAALRDLGRPGEALASFDAAVALSPNLSATHYNRGNSLRDLGRLEESLASYETAIRLEPRFGEAHKNRGRVLRDLGRALDALVSFDTALALAPDDADAHNDRGTVLRDLGRSEEALSAFDMAITLKPDHAGAHNNRGGALADLGRLDEALSSYDQAITLLPNDSEANAEVHDNRAHILWALGRPDEALSSFDTAIALKPDLVDAFDGRAGLLTELGRREEALDSFDRALALNPGRPTAHNRLGNALAVVGRQEEALAAYGRAIDLKPDFEEAYANRGATLRDLGRLDEALSSIDTAIELKPDYVVARISRGDVLRELGRPVEALASYEAAIDLITSKTTKSADVRGNARRKLGPEVRARLALGKFLADQKQYAEAFAQFQAVHLLLQPIEPFSREERLEFTEVSIAVFDRARLTTGARARNADPTPVFVVGMPRTGTTLCEQILAAHAQVFGAGERQELARTFFDFAGTGEVATALARVAALDATQLDSAADSYLSQLHALAPGKARIVDKMPGNFSYLGLVGMMLPCAKIIHCVRDPRDVGLSIYEQHFQANHGYAHDLADLGWFIGQEIQLMAHWEASLETPILTLRLNDWISDFDGTLARVLAHLGLPPDPNCARFYELDRWVGTPSRTQVREPINAKGLGRWRPYAKELAPMIAELEAAGALQGWDAA